jgi:hypothetical protein
MGKLESILQDTVGKSTAPQEESSATSIQREANSESNSTERCIHVGTPMAI